jgi:fumarate reductase subunit D
MFLSFPMGELAPCGLKSLRVSSADQCCFSCTIFIAEPINAATSVILLGTMVVVASWRPVNRLPHGLSATLLHRLLAARLAYRRSDQFNGL